jgi:hypothetical protein
MLGCSDWGMSWLVAAPPGRPLRASRPCVQGTVGEGQDLQTPARMRWLTWTRKQQFAHQNLWDPMLVRQRLAQRMTADVASSP